MEKRLPLYFAPNCLGRLDYQRYQRAINEFINCAKTDSNKDGFGNIVAMVRVSAKEEWVLTTGSSVALPETSKDNIVLIKNISSNGSGGLVSYYGDNRIPPTSEIIPWWMILREFSYHLKVIFHFHLAGNKYLSGKELGILETEEEKPQGRPEIAQEVIKTIKKHWQNSQNSLKKEISLPEIVAIKNHGYIILADSLDQAKKIYCCWKEKISQCL